ncbi:gibberellin 2-beta-dioxygenase 2-like [Humulus lupulus]|uniref:gibberellin 2-beta-dioxygenase 2-like n=1 Tax=Humulus lupulus TaxID=3486 RepID=UPI002B4086F5|nr:gibberellin 2-beta-dioxygenase 2-like [Humulus lupulus]
MVLATPNPILRGEKIDANIELPTIDLLGERKEVSRQIVKACEEFGFFKIINHGVPHDVISKMEEESLSFFSKPEAQKKQAGPANPYGYGCKTIGFNGDMGEVEYILLNTNPNSIAHYSNTISNNNPTKFSSAVSWYIEAVKGLACEILDLMANGLSVSDTKLFSRLIKDSDNDSLFRLNHYPSSNSNNNDYGSKDMNRSSPMATCDRYKVGFGEHSDPQILTLLRSNDVGGLQISLEDKVWVPVPPDPLAFWVNVGDVLQALTNGRFMSVRHRALVSNNNSYNRTRMSMAFFAAPPLNACVSAPKEMVTAEKPRLYRPFTWAEYKRTTYSLRLGDSRLNLFKIGKDHQASL